MINEIYTKLYKYTLYVINKYAIRSYESMPFNLKTRKAHTKINQAIN